MGDERGQHAGQAQVLRVHGAAVGLGGDVETRQVMADEDELGRILERHVLRHGLVCGQRRELTETRRASARLVAHDAAGDRDVARLDLPGARRGRDQHGACRRAGTAHLRVGVVHRGTAAGALRTTPVEIRVARRIGRRAFGTDLRPGAAEFLGDERRQAGERTLPELDVLDDDGDAIVGADAHESVGGERRRAGRVACGRCRTEADAEQQSAARAEAVAQELATVQARDAHASSSAARCTARRMRA